MRQAWKLNTAVFLMVFGLLTAALPAWAALMGGSIQGTPLNLTNTNAVVTTLAGVTLSTGSTDGTGTAARFYNPYGITTDGTNLFIADSFNHTIRKIAIATGLVTTIAGSPGNIGSADGIGAAARFYEPKSITTDGTSLFVADFRNHTIRKIVIATGVVTTFAGSAGSPGSADGVGSAARFNTPIGITTDGANLFIADTYNYTIRKIVISTAAVSTLAGSAGSSGSTNGIGSAARFWDTYGITTDGANLFVTDTLNHTIRKIVISTATVSTLAGSAGSFGSTDGTGSVARFFEPMGISTDGTYLYIGDNSNNTIRKIVISTAAVSTLAGSAGSSGSIDGSGLTSRFYGPMATTTDGSSLFVSDYYNQTIRKISPDTTAPTTISSPAGGTYTSAQSVTLTCSDGTGSGCDKIYYTTDGSTPTTSSGVYSTPINISATTTVKFFAKDLAGNSEALKAEGYSISPLMGGSIQGTPLSLTSSNAVVSTLAGLAVVAGSTDGTGTAARFNRPYGITTPDGVNLYIADANNSTIRKLVISTGQVTTIAGTAGVTGSTDGTGTAARFNGPTGITTDGTNLFVTDSNNYTIRKMVISTGVVTTIAGSPGLYGSTDGTGSAARFYNSYDLTTDGTNLYVADTATHTIRKVVISSGVVTTLAGQGGADGATDGTGAAARFFYPYSITTDGTNLYVTDSGNSTIRKVVISTGVVTTMAGSAGITGSTDGTGTAARFFWPRGITTDGGNLYVSDTDNATIRKIVISTGEVTTISGSAGSVGSTDGVGSSARFNWPAGINTDGINLFVSDNNNHTIRKIFPDVTPPTGSISINSGAAYTNATSVTLTLSCTDTNGCSQMQFSNDGTNWSPAETLATSKTWSLASGDGTKTVYVQFKDGAGNWSTVYSDTILLDSTAPTTAASPAGGTYTSAQSVILTGSETATIRYTTDGTTPATSSPVYTAPIGITKDTTLKFFAVDLAGNIEAVKTGTYVITAMNAIDTIPPANASNINASSNADGSVSLSWTAPTDSDLKGYYVYKDGTKINSQAVTTTSYKDSSVSIGSTYTYKVTSLDLAGNESSGVTKTATSTVQANTPPSAPSNVKVEDTGTGYSLKVVWPANTESDLAGYKVYWGSVSGVHANSQNAGNVPSYAITGLTEGTKYYVAVTAYDTEGNESAKSIEATGTPKAYASRSEAPAGLTVTEGNKCLTFSWTGVSNVTGYMVYIGETDGVYGTPVRTTSTTHTFQNLENGKTYYVAVSSYDLNSGSRYTVSSESERTSSSGTPYDNEAPAAPSNTTATDAGTGGSIALKWDREESFDIAGYVVAYKKTGNSVFEGITSIGVTWNYAVTGLTNGSSYTFYAYSYDDTGNFSEPSSVAAIPTSSGSGVDVTAPGVPVLSAAPGNGKVTLMITPPSDTDIDHYNLYVYNLAAGKYLPLTSLNGLSYEHSTGVDNGKALVFVATAVDAAGNESGYSTTASAVPSELPGDIPLEEDPPVLDRVDGYDVNEIAKGFGSDIGHANYNSNADLDGNGTVDGNDLLILGTNHGKKK